MAVIRVTNIYRTKRKPLFYAATAHAFYQTGAALHLSHISSYITRKVMRLRNKDDATFVLQAYQCY